ncbi:unnamed protein product [Rotaria sordida]|uniref:HAT C-terminal dimerisation domain-containing protein n=1 Tax=Rotaria sordida TaxID=392033 RepID=A0A815J108_9BILA|nr:unnamed protein product [Rotaria sordida]CAF1142128.1 unnamed protein product [Rotaria sordida]CAF1374033.1 unnamed protein product [Rotaria sordida]CAF4106620.1 unnamed protein product [Rotaria sordida]
MRGHVSEHVKKAVSISSLIPQYIADKNYDDLAPAIEIYGKFLPGSISEIRSEFLLWKKRWVQVDKENNSDSLSPSVKRKEQMALPDTAIDAYVQCTKAFYPNIKILLKIFATLSVLTATTERTFSVLNLLKTYSRSTTSETRLNSLAMMHIHRDININVDSVIDEFAKSNHRLIF